MTRRGADYSFSRPAPADLVAAGIVGVGRYLNGSGKAIVSAELRALGAVGIGVWFVFEMQANDSAGGDGAGRANATTAKNLLSGLGVNNRPIYFAVDADVNPQSAVPYFQGICSVINFSLVGVYGEGALCSLLRQEGLATWFWQSESTSFPGNASTLPFTQIQQTTKPTVAGCDDDELLAIDYGQWPAPLKPTPPPIKENDMPLYVVVDSKGTGYTTDLLTKKLGIPDSQDTAELSQVLGVPYIAEGKLDDAFIDSIPG